MNKKRLVALALAVVVLLCCMVAAIVALCGKNRDNTSTTQPPSTTTEMKAYPFPSLDIAAYCSLPASAWESMTVSLDESKYAVSDEDVLASIHALQAKYIKDCPTIHQVTDRTAQKGDTVYIYYAGYVDGLPFSGGCNIVTGPGALTLGSGQFIAGFEDGLVGVLPTDTAMVRRQSGDIVEADDIVYFSYTCTYLDHDGTDFDKDGTCTSVSAARIPLSTADDVYGEGFAANIIGCKMTDDKLTFVMSGDYDGDGQTEQKRYVGYVYLATQEQTVTVTATFPDTYPSDPTLAGKTATFEVIVEYIGEEEYPELTSSFVVETLKFEAKTGDPVSEFVAYIREELLARATDAREEAIEGELMNQLLDALTVTAYPEESVPFYMSRIYGEIEEEYAYYKEAYGQSFPFDSVDAYFIYCYGLSADADVTAYVRSYAEKMVKENLVVFYIGHALSLSVSDEEKQTYAKDLADEINASYGSTVVNADMVMEYYGEDYIQSCVMYQKVIEAVRPNVTVVPPAVSES